MIAIYKYELTPGKNLIHESLQDILDTGWCQEGLYVWAIYNSECPPEDHEFIVIKNEEIMPSDELADYYYIGTAVHQDEVWHVFKKFN